MAPPSPPSPPESDPRDGSAAPPAGTAAGSALRPRARLAVDFGPLAIFFVTYFVGRKVAGERPGVMWGTGLFVLATTVALAYAYRVERKVQPMALVTGAIVLVLGGLTLYLNDETFIQVKPTLASGLMGGLLLGGLLLGRSLLQPLMGTALDLDEEGWRKLTLRWGLFFLGIAALNEVARRQLDFSAWLTFKTVGIIGLTFVFLLTQAPLLQKHARPPEGTGSDEGPGRGPGGDGPTPPAS
ncbi:MAG: inner membrane-spanning protein YciB [Planctomycetota bacterium]